MGSSEGKWSCSLGVMLMVVMVTTMRPFQVYGCWDEERAALLLLQASAPHPIQSGSWKNNKTSDCCEWEGVSCGANKRIISLDINSEFEELNVRWHVNASIFLPLKELQKLDLHFNLVASWTEAQGSEKLSTSLKNLVSLDLGYNFLNNSIFSELSGFSSLTHLNLEWNEVKGTIQLHDCEQKHELAESHVHGNSSCFKGLPSLRELDLSNNQLAGDIPSWLQNLTTLESLDLSSNLFTGNIGSSPLTHLFSLEFLALSSNYLQIPLHTFANHTKLKYFLGDFNQVVRDVLEPPDIQHFPHGLQVFSISDCSLFEYPRFLLYHRNLRIIDLSNNFLQGEFPTWLLENNTRLNTLMLNNCSLSGSIPLPLLTHSYISHINIAQNKIQGHIPPNIGIAFPNLNILDLSNNDLMGHLPSSLCDLKSLKGLYLSNNHIFGGIEKLWKRCINLESLDLSYNNFIGRLPSFRGLLKMKSLKLQGNNFSGSIMRNMFGLNPFEVLDLHNNSLEGSIPEDICNASGLGLLDLSFNKLNGTLPYCSSQQGLSLYLNNNRLSGHLTDAFFHNVQWMLNLDLSYNDLTGHIPPALGNLTNLNTLVLRGNRFHGQIPIQLCKLLSLNVLVLSSNNLSGPIPTCLGERTTFNPSVGTWGIALSNDEGSTSQLSQLIDQKGFSIGQMISSKVEFTTKSNSYIYEGSMYEYLVGIDLSCNMLTGYIPHELGNLSDLLALNLSHNKLWGAIPPSFSNLKNIESMDLSYNNLTGSIPSMLTTLNTLGVFKVAYNNLSGRIPYEVQFSTFDNSTYQGNPLLCGPPLSKQCSTSEVPSAMNKNASTGDDDDDSIDMKTFYVTFAVSGATMFIAVVVVMLVNPLWHNSWYNLVKVCITASYYFLEDSIRKLRRSRHV